MAATLPISPIGHNLRRSSRFGNNASTPRFCSPILSISPCLIGSASELRARLPLVSSAVTTNSILHDVGATVAVLGGAYALVLSFENLTKRNVIPQVSFIADNNSEFRAIRYYFFFTTIIVARLKFLKLCLQDFKSNKHE